MDESTRPGPRFRLGFTCILLAWATLNALSYFGRSDGWGNLLGNQPDAAEAIGFPWIIWEEGPGLNSSRIDPVGLAADAALGIICSILAGLAAVGCKRMPVRSSPLPCPPAAVPTSPRKLQFSLRALLMVAVVEALVFGLIQASVEARPVLLLAVYLLGPLLIVGVAHRLHLNNQQPSDPLFHRLKRPSTLPPLNAQVPPPVPPRLSHPSSPPRPRAPSAATESIWCRTKGRHPINSPLRPKPPPRLSRPPRPQKSPPEPTAHGEIYPTAQRTPDPATG